MKKELRAYLRAVRTLCPPKQRRRFIRDLKNDILQSQETTPDCDMPAVIARFGTPTEIAASFVEINSDNQLLSRKRQTIFLLILVTTIALIIGITALALQWSDAYSDSHIQRIYTDQEDNNYENTETN